MAQQVVAAAPETGKEYKTCKLVLVNSGRSDSVLKIRPAQHAAEKIFLDNTQGIERWEAIQRLMQNSAKRGTMVSRPVEYCTFPDLKTIVITEEDIPMVELEGAIFVAPPEVKSIGDIPTLPPSMVALESRVNKIEQAISETNALLTKIALALPTVQPENVGPEPRRGRGRPNASERQEQLR